MRGRLLPRVIAAVLAVVSVIASEWWFYRLSAAAGPRVLGTGLHVAAVVASDVASVAAAGAADPGGEPPGPPRAGTSQRSSPCTAWCSFGPRRDESPARAAAPLPRRLSRPAGASKPGVRPVARPANQRRVLRGGGRSRTGADIPGAIATEGRGRSAPGGEPRRCPPRGAQGEAAAALPVRRPAVDQCARARASRRRAPRRCWSSSAHCRLSLDDGAAQLVPLEQELAVLDHYLAIEHIRFADRLRVTGRIAPDTRRALVPNLVLQPLVENAIKHGLSRSLPPAASTSARAARARSWNSRCRTTGLGWSTTGSRPPSGAWGWRPL